jgi:hypothetical protein
VSCTSSARGPAAPRARARMARVTLIAMLAAVAAAVSAAPAGASLTAAGPVNPATGFPDWYQDATGLQLQLCLDGLPACSASAAAGDLAPPDGEAFWWRATGDLRSGSLIAKLALAQEAAFADGGRITFARARVTITGGQGNTTYTIQHPYGTLTVTTDANGGGRSADPDIGCAAAPCDFAAALGGQVGPFLHWDPTVAPAPAAGYIGDAATPHRVVGSPTGFNAFALSGGGLNLTTDQLTVEGKLAGPPVPVADAAGSVDFGTTAPGAPVQRTVTIRSFGVPDAGGRSNLVVGAVAVAGAQAGAFTVVGNTCGAQALPSGASCQVVVQLTPGAPGRYGATLSVATNAAGGQTAVALTGAATPAVAAAGARGRLTVRRLRTTHRLTRARVLRRGLRLTMRLPQGTEIVKVAIRRVRHGRALRRPVWLGYRVVAHAGLYRLRLDSRALRRRLTPGLYQVNVTPGVSRRQLGRTTTTRIRVTRR